MNAAGGSDGCGHGERIYVPQVEFLKKDAVPLVFSRDAGLFNSLWWRGDEPGTGSFLEDGFRSFLLRSPRQFWPSEFRW